MPRRKAQAWRGCPPGRPQGGIGKPSNQQHALDLCRVLDVPTPADVPEDVILSRLLALNAERAGG
jgi:hypothetical protein